MKRILIFLLLIIPSLAFSQNDIIDESIEQLEKLNEILIGDISSFCAYPQIHNNTIKVYNKILDTNDFCKKQQNTKYSLSSSSLSNYKVKKYFARLNEIQSLSEIFEELLRPIGSGISSGLNQNQKKILDIMLNEVGWKITVLNINCRDACFYEYEFNGFKMTFIQNTLPLSDLDITSSKNLIEVSFTNNYHGSGGNYNIGAGKCRMIQYKDDKNISYYKIIKASSIRIN